MIMCRIQRNRQVVLLTVVTHLGVVATFLQAEPMLLAQFYHARTQPDTANEMFIFSYTTGASADIQARLETRPTIADIGRTFATAPATVEDFHEVFTSGGTIPIISSFGASGMFQEFVAQEFFTGSFMGEFPSMSIPETNHVVMKAFVPQLGPNFSGYRITGVEQTIDGMSIRQLNPSTFLYWGAQTIRIFGEQIPEPATWLVVAAGLPVLFARANRKASSLVQKSRGLRNC